MSIVEVKHVARGPVEQGRVHRVYLLRPAEDGSLAWPHEGPKPGQDRFDRGIVRPTDTASHPVEQGADRFRPNRFGHVLEAAGERELSKGRSHRWAFGMFGHGAPQNLWNSAHSAAR